MIKNALKKVIKLMLKKTYREKYFWLKRLSKIPRYTLAKTTLQGHEITLIDSASFLFMYDEIFEQEIYKFNTDNPTPLIIDAGANIGLSTIYFKLLHPNSRVIVFEPDLKIFKILEDNIKSFDFTTGVSIINKAVWFSETQLTFMEECADGGRVVEIEDSYNRYQVDTVRLRDYLGSKIDFLKIDIEGAETKVIEDCQDLLMNVRNIFIEYHSFVEQPQTLDKILSILQKQHFRYYVHQLRNLKQPFIKTNSYLGMDMILNIFAWRSI